MHLHVQAVDRVSQMVWEGPGPVSVDGSSLGWPTNKKVNSASLHDHLRPESGASTMRQRRDKRRRGPTTLASASSATHKPANPRRFMDVNPSSKARTNTGQGQVQCRCDFGRPSRSGCTSVQGSMPNRCYCWGQHRPRWMKGMQVPSRKPSSVKEASCWLLKNLARSLRGSICPQ